MTVGADRLEDDQLAVLKSLARAPRSAASSEVGQLQKLIDLGLAYSEKVAGRALLYAITPAGRRAIASSRGPPRPLVRRDLPDITVSAMQEAGWRVYSVCDDCGASASVDLDLIAWRYGGRTRLTGRRTRCLLPGCGGMLAYLR